MYVEACPTNVSAKIACMIPLTVQQNKSYAQQTVATATKQEPIPREYFLLPGRFPLAVQLERNV